MRSIDISTDLFALIWATRLPNEDTENDVLLRVMREYIQLRDSPVGFLSRDSNDSSQSISSLLTRVPTGVQEEGNNSTKSQIKSNSAAEHSIGKIRWVDDVRDALHALGGGSSLQKIYKEVEMRRCNGNRSTPKTLEAIVRRTLEEHSSDSMNFTRNMSSPDIFANTGRGEWALRN